MLGLMRHLSYDGSDNVYSADKLVADNLRQAEVGMEWKTLWFMFFFNEGFTFDIVCRFKWEVCT